MKKKLSFLLACVLSLGMMLTACGDGGSTSTVQQSTGGTSEASTTGQEPVVLNITWWGAQERHEYTQKMLDLYTEQNPHVTFEASPSSWDGYFEKLSVQASGGTMPDLIQMDYLYIATYANGGTLADLGPYLADGTLDATYIDESMFSSGYVDGALVGIPYSTSVFTMTYNPEILAEAGLDEPTQDWTWDDFVEMCKTVYDETGKWGFANNLEDTGLFLYWVRQYGENLFNEDGTALGYEDPSVFADLANMLKELIDYGATPNPDQYLQIKALDFNAQPMAQGEAAFIISWNNFTTTVAETNPNLKMITPPVSAINDKAIWLKPGAFWSVAETCENKEEAVKFIDWFMNSTEANDIMMAERGTPVSSAMRDHLKPNLGPQQGDMFDYVDMATPYAGDCPAPDPEGIQEVTDILVNYMNQVMYGAISAEAAAEVFYTEANNILARNAA